MKLLLALALATLLLPARAQTAPATVPNPGPRQSKAISEQTADRRAATYKGPKVVPNSQELGRKFMRKSEPLTQPVSPVKK